MQTPFLSFLTLAQRTHDAARQFQRQAGRYVPPDLAEPIIKLADDIVRAASDPQGALAMLADQVFWLGHSQQSVNGYIQRLLPARADELAILVRSATLLLHIHLHPQDAARRPVAVSTAQQALLIAEWLRSRLPSSPLAQAVGGGPAAAVSA